MYEQGRKQKRVVVYVPEEDYNKLRSKLMLTGMNVSKWFRNIVKEFLQA